MSPPAVSVATSLQMGQTTTPPAKADGGACGVGGGGGAPSIAARMATTPTEPGRDRNRPDATIVEMRRIKGGGRNLHVIISSPLLYPSRGIVQQNGIACATSGLISVQGHAGCMIRILRMGGNSILPPASGNQIRPAHEATWDCRINEVWCSNGDNTGGDRGIGR